MLESWLKMLGWVLNAAGCPVWSLGLGCPCKLWSHLHCVDLGPDSSIRPMCHDLCCSTGIRLRRVQPKKTGSAPRIRSQSSSKDLNFQAHLFHTLQCGGCLLFPFRLSGCQLAVLLELHVHSLPINPSVEWFGRIAAGDLEHRSG